MRGPHPPTTRPAMFRIRSLLHTTCRPVDAVEGHRFPPGFRQDSRGPICSRSPFI